MANEDPSYSSWIRTLACALCGKAPRSEQHHRSGAGMGRRAHDHESMPLCHACHHTRLGRIPRERRRDFEASAVVFYRALARVAPGSPHYEVPEKRQKDLF